MRYAVGEKSTGYCALFFLPRGDEVYAFPLGGIRAAYNERPQRTLTALAQYALYYQIVPRDHYQEPTSAATIYQAVTAQSATLN